MKQDTVNPANATTSKSNHLPIDIFATANQECVAENFDKAELLLASLPAQTKESVLLQSKIYYLTDRLDKCKKLIYEAISDGLLSKNDYQKTALLGWVLLKESKLDEAFALFNSVFNCPHSEEMGVGRAKLMHFGGICYHRLGKNEQARQLLRDSEAIFRANNDAVGLTEAMTASIVVNGYTGQLIDAQFHFEEVVELLKDGVTPTRKAANLQQLAIVLIKRGFAAKVLPMLEEAETIQKNRTLQLTRIDLIRGRAHAAQGNLTDAEVSFQKALSRSTDNGYLRENAIALESLGDLEAERKNYDQAEQYFNMALEIGKSTAPEGNMVAGDLRRLGTLEFLRGNYAEAITLLEDSLIASEKCTERFEEGLALRDLSRAHCALGVNETACRLARKSIAVFKSCGADVELAESQLVAAEARLSWHLAGNGIADDTRRSHLDASWSYVIEAFHAFADLDNTSGVSRCEALIVRLHDSGGALWKRRVSASANTEEVNGKAFIANSPVMRRVLGMIDVGAASNEPVLITGETGTGKELVAKLVHSRSTRSDGPFVPVNCAAIPDTLFEREFFGHAAGAFTGADTARAGLCEEADGGTLFLDEIGDMPQSLQVKLLRVLQEGTFRRLGDPAERRVDLRIVAATNAGLSNLIEEGLFREDLYYRLQTLELEIPPLRERAEDMDSLIEMFVSKMAGDGATIKDVLDQDAQEAMRRYPWPGNVRELESITRRMTLMAMHAGKATLEMLPEKIRNCRVGPRAVTWSMNLATHVARAEKECITRALIANNGNRSATAKVLGISRNGLYKKIDKLKVKV
ncbi:MAG: tetratricopeptide repeat protein [bacterium]|nr:tetratricopeptide repeat protein [bacterium]